jgi:hypothetical protein
LRGVSIEFLVKEKEEAMKKTIMMQTLGVAMLAMCLAGVGGCGGDDATTETPAATETSAAAQTSATAETSEMMPSSAIGVVHIDVAKTRDGIIAAAEKDKETFGPFLSYLEVLKKIDSADIYLIPSGSKPMPLVAIRGTLGPDDITAILAKTEMKDAKLVKGENGRYTLEGMPVVMIVGNEADDVPAGVVLGGVAPMLMPEFIAALGKKKNTAVEAIIAKADTSAQIWAGIAMPEKEQTQGAPKEIYGSANITGPNPLNVSFLFGDEANAAKTMKKFDDTPPFIKEVIALKQTGTTVNVSMIGEGNLIDNAIKMIKGVIGGMMGGAKTPPPAEPAPK